MIDYIPILTTFLSIYFFIEIYKHYSSKKKEVLAMVDAWCCNLWIGYFK